MTSEWLGAVPGILAAGVVVAVPGLLVGMGLRLRGLTLVAVAPVISASVAGVFGVIFQLVGISWSPYSFFGATLVTVLVVAAVRRLTAGRRLGPLSVDHMTETPLPTPFEWIGLTVGIVLQVALISYVWGQPSHVSQTIDAVFHLNAIRWIEATGSASSLTLGQMNGSGFYPSGWHSLVATTAELAGLTPATATYCTAVVFGAVVWVPGCLYLTRQVMGLSRPAPVIAGVASGAFGAFPLLMLDFGVLYPNMLVVAMLPVCVAIAAQALGVSAAPSMSRRTALVLLAIGLPGLVLVHPSGLHSIVALSWPMLVVALGRGWKHQSRVGGRRWPVVAVFGIALALTVALWVFVHPDPSTYWDPVQSRAQSLGEAFSVAPMAESSSPVSGILVVLGIVALVRSKRSLWAVGMAAVAFYLFVNVAAYDALPFRRSVTGPWYNDSYRLAALLPVVAVPLVTVGVTRVGAWFAAARFFGSRSQVPRTAALVAAAMMLILGQYPNVSSAMNSAHRNYEQSPASPLLTTDERALIDRLPGEVPSSSLIVGNPWTGTSLAFALADRRTVQLHLLSSTTPDVELVDRSLRDALRNPAVCRAVRKLGVGYVLDFGTTEIAGGHHNYDGLRFLVAEGVAKVIDSVGDAELLQITACS